MSLTVAHVSLPMLGELANGDRALFRTDEAHRGMFAVVDGLGHGPGAAEVSRIAAECLESISLEMPLLDIMETLHGSLSGTRCAAATVCVVRGGEIEVCAVGNVEVRSAELRLPLVFSAGILGSRVQKFHVCRTKLLPRSRLVLFSDGISSRTAVEDVRKLSPQDACDAIIKRYRRNEDDATVLVADSD